MADDQQKEVQEQEEAPATEEAQAPETTSEETGEEATAEAVAEEVTEEAPVEESTEEEAAAPEASEESEADASEVEEASAEAAEEAEEAPAEEEAPAAEAVEAEAEPESAPEEAPASEPSISESDALATATGMIGYTGEISGEVFKLEDLENITDETDPNVGLDDLRKLVENTLTNVSENEIVAGKVISISEKDVVIDIGFKSDGIVSRSEFGDELAEFVSKAVGFGRQ